MRPTITILIALLFSISINAQRIKTDKPWSHGRLQVAPGDTYLCHADGTPFFWLGDTGWLLPERLDRDEAACYLAGASKAGYNVVQVQTINAVPAFNIYGRMSHPDGWDFSRIDRPGEYGYWDHMDYIIKTAADNGIYIAMVPIWGGLVKSGQMNEHQARDYGRFLGSRYKDAPNIVWLIGGDLRGDIKPEVWHALATAIKEADLNHLMSYHPFGRTSSDRWFHTAPWLDFNMAQSGHRRYDQTRGDGDDAAQASQAEDNWRYIESMLARSPRKPAIDGEPSYEEIPQGLHDPSEPWWKAPDARRYGYWAVFAGAFGHTYGHSSVMQMLKSGVAGGYGAVKPWWEGMKDPGYNQMKHLRNLITTFPMLERVPDQSIIAGENGERYDRLIATRGTDYLLVYNYTSRPMTIDLTRISGDRKHAWWYSPVDGSLDYIGEFDNRITTFIPATPAGPGNDLVLIATSTTAPYLTPSQPSL